MDFDLKMMVPMVEEVKVPVLKVVMVVFELVNLELVEVKVDLEVVAFARFHPPDYCYRKQS